MPTYYPSALCQFHIRFEDGIGEVPSEALAVLRGEASPFSGVEELLAFQKPDADDPLSHIIHVQPTSSLLARNHHRTADLLDISVAYRDMPIDPQMIRSLGVSFYFGTVHPDEFSRGVTSSGNDIRRAVVPATTMDVTGTLTRRNRRFVGFADDIDVDVDAGLVHIKASDFLSVLAAQPIPVTLLRRLNLKLPLDQLIQQLISGFPGQACRGLKIVPYQVADPTTGLIVPLPTLASDSVGTEVYRIAGQNRPGASIGGSDISFWDLITDWCVRSGIIPIIDQTELRLTPPRTLFGRDAPGSFRRRVPNDVGVETEVSIRRMVHGNNLANLKFNRKYNSKRTVSSVVVVGVVPEERLRLVAQWPIPNVVHKYTKRGKLKREKVGRGFVLPSGKGASQQVRTLVVRGIRDIKVLYRAAQALFEELSRDEFGGSFTTYNMASFGGDNEDPDLLDLISGDPIEVVVRGSEGLLGLSDYLSKWKNSSESEQIDALKRKGYSDVISKAWIKLYRAYSNLQTVYRVGEVRFESEFSGPNPNTAIAVTFSNYLELSDEFNPGTPTDLKMPSVTVGSPPLGYQSTLAGVPDAESGSDIV